MKKTVYICLLLLVLSCTSREKPYSCKLVELQDLNTFPVIDFYRVNGYDIIES